MVCRPPRKHENAVSSIRHTAGHDSLSSKGSPAYMQILCRLGCQPDHLLDSTRGYLPNSSVWAHDKSTTETWDSHGLEYGVQYM